MKLASVINFGSSRIQCITTYRADSLSEHNQVYVHSAKDTLIVIVSLVCAQKVPQSLPCLLALDSTKRNEVVA